MTHANESPKQAARRLAAGAIRNGFKPQALHEYHDQDGTPLFWRIRAKHPDTGEKWIRPMKLNGQGYTLGEPEFQDSKPLYRLHELAVRTTEDVYVVEGETCVDVLAKLGLLATTSGGADSAEKADWTILAGRTVTLWPDNDEAGQHYAKSVEGILRGLDCTVRMIDVTDLGLPPKGDVVDWLVADPDATAEDIAGLPRMGSPGPLEGHQGTKATPDMPEPGQGRENAAGADPEGEEDSNKSQASALVAFVEKHTDLFHDQNKEVYAKDHATLETRRLDGRQFRDWLVAGFYQATGKSPRDQSVREALSTLSGLGRFKGECLDVHVRVAAHGGAYFLDLGEPGRSRAVKIEPGHWELVDDPPTRFIRSESMRPLPEPIAGGDISVVWRIANIPEEARLLVLTWLGECLRPDTPFPVLELIGEQGSAKSTAQTALRRLIDPNACDLRAAPKAVEDVFITAGVNWLVSYENISHLPAPMQDALCVLATGGGFAKRKLYSDADESVIVVKRPVVLNGIGASVTAQDLIDRAITVETPVIESASKMDVTVLWRLFEAEHGRLLGVLLDTMAHALARLPGIQLPPEQRPRLIEFARFGMAMAEALGSHGEDFMQQFNASRQDAIARTIDANPVATALIEWFDARGRRETDMPVKELFRAVESHRPANTDAWPRSAKGFGDALRRIAPALRHLGIECRSLGRMGGNVRYKIKSRENFPDPCPASPACPADSVDQDMQDIQDFVPEISSDHAEVEV